MARRRKADGCVAPQEKTVWRIGKYIRLSREDGGEVSESVVNQDKILTDELPAFFEDGSYELVDTYIDDGTSGTTDLEREDFQRMVRDVKAGRINCIVVKNLSRAFRNSANQGKFLEEFIPLYRTRFISLYQPRLDTLLDPEVVHSLEVGVTGFMNEQYAYKTSCDVRRTLKHKRERGEFVGAFAPYGYEKDAQNRNALVVDEEAAAVVRDVFSWFVTDGMSKAGIVRRLNELGVPCPSAHRRRKAAGKAPLLGVSDALWNAHTVSAMLQNPLYVGVLRQGRQRVVSYKVHKVVRVPESEWDVVEGAVPPIVDRAVFDAAQRLHRRDTRTPAERREVYLFSGLVRCADCGRAMARHASKGYVYYACRTYREQSRTACGKHSIRLDALERAMLGAVREQLAFLDLPALAEEIERADAPGGPDRLSALLAQKHAERAKTEELLDGLYCDWKSGDLSHEQYRRLRERAEARIARLREEEAGIASERAAQQGADVDPDLAAFLARGEIETLTRGLLTELVDAVYVHGDGSLDVAFRFRDPRGGCA